jgi:hypothetical protein
MSAASPPVELLVAIICTTFHIHERTRIPNHTSNLDERRAFPTQHPNLGIDDYATLIYPRYILYLQCMSKCMYSVCMYVCMYVLNRE